MQVLLDVPPSLPDTAADRERNQYAEGKRAALSMVARGEEYDRDMAQAMYECFLCDACTNDCATGYEPPLFIREARTEAVVKNLAPSAVMGLIDREEEKEQYLKAKGQNLKRRTLEKY